MSELEQITEVNGADTITAVALLDEEEKHRLLVEWNATEMKYPREQCVHGLFEEQVERTPDEVAVCFEDRQLTYRELNGKANQLAHYLKGRGVGPEGLVGICLERSLDMVVGLLGTLKVGGAYVPLDPGYPKERLTFILQDAKAHVLLTQKELAQEMRHSAPNVVSIDSDWPAISRESEQNLEREVTSQNLAYVLYTSGSTGRPKGVQIEHRNVVNFLYTMAERPGIKQGDVLVAVTTLSFDIAGLEMYLPLMAGARIALAGRRVVADGALLRALIEESGATIMQATPATWRLLIESGWRGSPKLKILCGGEALPRDLAVPLLPRCASLWNMYGPTETTIWSSVYRVQEANEAVLPIGGPIGNTQMYILDANLQPVPVGTEGELYIGGDGVARGYLNRPELTKEKFIPDPFRKQMGVRLYRTGDLARYQPEGNIAFLGRIDHQVKIRGYRVEVGEVEAALAQYRGVQQNVVVAREDSPGQKRLVAYIVPKRYHRPQATKLRSFLKDRLPDYMVPSVFVLLEYMPLTPNGKVDRLSLPAPDRNNSAQEVEYVAPTDPLELQLTKIWEEVLHIQPIGIHDNIFDLGVHSLVAAQLFARIEKTFGRRLPPGPLFQAPTVAQLAKFLRQNETQARWTSLVAIQPNGSKSPLFCVHGGAGTVLLFHDLARLLAAEDRPVYGLQAQGLYGGDAPHTSVEEMATHYIGEIRTVQPKGPYHVGGWCFGGLVAYEVARQLRRQGEEVALLAMFNAPSTADQQPTRLDPPSRSLGTSWKARQWHKLLGADSFAGKVARHAQCRREQVKDFQLRLAYKGRQRLYRYYLSRRRPLPDFLRERYFVEMTKRAEHKYVLRPYPGTLALFRDNGPFVDSALGWGRFVTGEIKVYEIPLWRSDHRALMMGLSAQTLMQKLKEYLGETESQDRAQEQVSSN